LTFLILNAIELLLAQLYKLLLDLMPMLSTDELSRLTTIFTAHAISYPTWMDGWLGFLRHFKRTNSGYIMPERVFKFISKAILKHHTHLIS